MGSSCFDNKNNNEIIKNDKIINLYGCSDETHSSLQNQNNNNIKIIEEEYMSTKQKSPQIHEINENIRSINNISINQNQNQNQSAQNINPHLLKVATTLALSCHSSIKEDKNNVIISIKDTDEEKDLLDKLFEIIKEKEGDTIKTKAIIEYNNGDKYIGEIDEKNQRNGRGIQIFNNNNIYYGFWKNNEMNGKGKMIKYNEKIDDLNIIFNETSMPFYYGDWKNNLEDGNGEEIWVDKSIYKGQYKEGFKEGNGILILADGTEYNGEFHQGKIEGKGIIKYKDGRIYEGNWMNNKMNGKGQFKWPDGRIFKGNYLNNYKNGYGEFFWPNGKIYKGLWINGKQNGKGKLYNKEHDIWIKGIWKDGKRIKGKNV